MTIRSSIFRVLLFMLLLCAFALPANAEPLLEHASGELYADGGIAPEQSPLIPLADGAVSFDSYLTAALEAYETEIDVSQFGFSREEFNSEYAAVLNRHAGLFYVSNTWSYRMTGNVVISVLPQYRYSISSLPERIKDFNAEVRTIARHANKASTTVGKLLLAYDYFCVNYEYDTTYTINSADQFFRQGKGVCQAYTMAYRAVLDELGITSTIAVSEKMNHIWNMVRVGSQWYHVDVTWGDPVPDMHLRVTHTSFLRSDKGIRSQNHYGWEASVSAASTKYDDYFWQDLNYPVPVSGSKAYYVANNFTDTRRTVRAFNLSTEKSSAVHTYDYGNYPYYRNFNPVWVYGPDLYFAVRDKLYLIPLSGGSARLIFSTGDSSEWIWSIYQSGSSLKMHVNDNPNSNGRIRRTSMDVYELELDRTRLITTVGDKTRLTGTITPTPDYDVPVSYSSENARVASISSSGVVTGVAPGVTNVCAYIYPGSEVACRVIVHDDAPLRIPAELRSIPEEAFAGAAAREIVIPEGVTAIEKDAFAGCSDLILLTLPDSIVSIEEGALPDHDGLTLIVHSKDSYAAEYAEAHDAAYIVLPAE